MTDWPSPTSDAGCPGAACSLPVGFFRLRYFHGKQMRLADYVDEQRYHAGKMRLHNEKLHGAGILCGLKVSLLQPEGPLLRVARGAALDDCGHEIVVGWDQCVDVGAWFAQQKRLPRDTGHDPCQPDADQRVHVCVVLRYAECANGPEPAPAAGCATPGGGGSGCGCGSCSPGGVQPCPDPCGGGAEYGRVAEEFELRLMFADEARRVTRHALFPSHAAIDSAVADAFGGIGLLQGLAGAMRERCPGRGESWLMLACFDLVIDEADPSVVKALVDIDLRCASQVLLSTEVLQYLVAGLVAEVEPGTGGPEIRSITLRRTGEKHYQFVIALTKEIEAASLDEDSSFNLRQMTRNGWAAPASRVVTMHYRARRIDPEDLDGPAIYLDVDNDSGEFLKPGGRYQLYTPAGAEPVVDALLRPLRPRQLLWRFGLERNDQGELALCPLTAHGGRHG